MPFADLDCVTLDARGTLIELVDPVPELVAALARHACERPQAEVEAAFRREIAFYLEHAVGARDKSALATLRRDCAEVFLTALDADLDPEEFARDLAISIRFAVIEGVVERLERLRSYGLLLAVVSNWDISLSETLSSLGLAPLLDLVVSSAEAGAAKPDPRIFRYALERLSVAPERALHVGDEKADAAGALAAGMRFVSAPLENLFGEGE
jgi:putative hydrolase of the HAD superfamily